MSASQQPEIDWLPRYAKLVVGLTFVLIFLGGLVTSWQAGMAVPDWPLSFGSINPDGWWANFPVRLEHGHRMFAENVATLVAILCCWVWGKWRPLLIAFVTAIVSGVLAGFLAHAGGVSHLVVMHLTIWPCVGAYLFFLLRGEHDTTRPAAARKLALAAFIVVCIQAILGGLRVTIETGGSPEVAMVFRIFHGCVAQAELCLLVALATVLSPAWKTFPGTDGSYGTDIAYKVTRGLRRLSWALVIAVYLQLIFGATMRHLGAGLAIPTFPQAAPSGSLMPAVHNAYVDLNLTHTRFGALIITVLALLVAISVIRSVPGEARIAWALLALIAVQVTLGVLVIWYTKPRTLTTFHVVNGALVLATSLLLALRLSRGATATESPARVHGLVAQATV